MTAEAPYADWAPRHLKAELLDGRYDSDPKKRAVVERLCSYPEMETAWKQYFDWHGESIYDYSRLVDFAFQAVSTRQDAQSLSEAKRRKGVARIAKHARLLKADIANLGIPDRIFRFIPQEKLLQLFEEVAQDAFTINTETGQIKPEWSASPQQAQNKLNFMVEFASSSNIVTYPIRLDEPSYYLSITTLLDGLSNEKLLLESLPPHLVSRAKFDNETKLLLIRKCAAHLRTRHLQEPKAALSFISSFARTVLDDADIDESTVKDALRSFNPGSR